MQNLIGTILSNKYEVLEIIGTGGMAVVYKGRDVRLGRNVAIKVLKSEFNNDIEFTKRFQTESMAIASLSHPNIVNVFDVGFTDDLNYIVMELVTGNTIRDYLNALSGFMVEEAIINIGIQIGSALSQAHNKGVVHRDIKAQNILIDNDGRIKVADFGIARAATDRTIVKSSDVFGSVHYASPEQARGEDVDRRSDIYSLGILLYELATKELPFNADRPVTLAMMQIKQPMPDPRKINDKISAGLAKIIQIATQKNPLDRYQSVSELINDLRKLKQNRAYVPVVRVTPTIDAADNVTHRIDRITREMEDLEVKSPESESEPVSKVNAVIAILSGLGLALLIIAAIVLSNLWKNLDDGKTKMIDVRGRELSEAIMMLQEIGLKAEAQEYRSSETVPANHVISCSVDEGTTLKRGYTVKLTVSTGDQLSKVPNVLNLSLERAIEMLSGQKLEKGQIKYEYSDLPSGTVLSQSPEADRELPSGSSVDLVVSQGPKNVTVLVPPLASMTVRRADSTLLQLGLKLGEPRYEDNDEIPKGIVISNTRLGEEVPLGTVIDIVVSNGPKETTEPTTEPTTQPTTSEALSEPTEKIITIYLLTSNFDADTSMVRIDFVNEGEKKIVYQGEHHKNEGESIPVTLTLKGRGQGKLFIYFGSFLKQEEDIIF